MPSIGEFLRERLLKFNITEVFGTQGEYSSQISKIFGSKIKLIPSSTALGAGHAADASARLKGFGVVCVANYSGGFGVLNAIVNAYVEQSPVLVISIAPPLSIREKSLHSGMLVPFQCQSDVYSNVTCATAVMPKRIDGSVV